MSEGIVDNSPEGLMLGNSDGVLLGSIIDGIFDGEILGRLVGEKVGDGVAIVNSYRSES